MCVNPKRCSSASLILASCLGSSRSAGFTIDRHQEQHDRVERRRQNLESVVAEGAFRIGWALSDPDGDKRDGEGCHIGEHVRGIGKEREAARQPGGDQLDDQERRAEGERKAAGVHGPARLASRPQGANGRVPSNGEQLTGAAAPCHPACERAIPPLWRRFRVGVGFNP